MIGFILTVSDGVVNILGDSYFIAVKTNKKQYKCQF